MWDEVIKFVGGTAVLISAVAWLIRSLTTYLLSKDIAIFKQELKTQAEKELASLKSKLEIDNAKIQIQFSALHARRILLIEKLYEKLIVFSNEADSFGVESLLGDNEEIKIKADKFIDNYYEFYRFFKKHEIFLSENIVDLIKSLHKTYFDKAVTIRHIEGDEVIAAMDTLSKNYENIRTSNERIRNSLKQEFRNLLGVDTLPPKFHEA